MLWTPKTEKAFNIAAALHDGQYRKGGEKLPVITHLVGVAGIVSKYTDDEDVVAAALLHDTLEDTAYTAELMREAFGERVATFVLGTSIPEAVTAEEDEWTKDRTRYLHNLEQSPRESALIAAADKIYNFSSVLGEYVDKPDQFRKDFEGTPEDRILVYERIVALLSDRIPEALGEELERVWRQYVAFIESLIEV